ncbi:hypothetical protein Mapa_009100 [Marchantia paleacea]|nr:hypothetical protein Mapa_009100 [Marchantia paleacea]
MSFLKLLVALSFFLASVRAATAPAGAPSTSIDNNPTSTELTDDIIVSKWILYTGAALNGFKNVVFTKAASDPSTMCHITGYYDPTARNATTAMTCFQDLQALIVYAYQQGIKVYYTGTMYVAGPDGPDDDCAVICRSFSGSSAAYSRGTIFSYGALSLVVSTAIVLVAEFFY